MSMREIKESELADASPVLPAGEVVEIVREWVDLHARNLPAFAGAYLWAGITALPADAPFHLFRDVDVVVVFTDGAPEDEQEVYYRGLMLEIISKNLEVHMDAEKVLADPSSGPNVATTQILFDPTGILMPLHQRVAAEYGCRRWVEARCRTEIQSAEEWLAAMREATTPVDRMISVRVFLGALSGLLAVAQLKRPTTRRTLALMRELLEAHGRSDLHEMALMLMGSAETSHESVRALLERCLMAFDRAVQVYRTPVPYGFAMRPHLRPYHAEGTEEMIDEGNHRESVYWITCLDTAYLVLENDAPDDEKPVFQANLQGMYDMLGYASDEAWAQRIRLAEHLAPEIYRIAEAQVALHPE